jgi:putative nucleotidyltransferase with HDIG domain
MKSRPNRSVSIWLRKSNAHACCTGEANRIVRNLIQDVRLGKQVELEQLDPVVENIITSVFRNQDALLPLLRLKDHDNYTFQHSVSVCALLVSFARGLKLERPIIKEIAIGGLLHDVGKAKVPDDILNKPAKLTEAEFAKMKSHVVQSILILQNTPGISQIALDVAGQHHERFDGTGYPNKLKGDEISLYGRMGAIVDVYDAITSDRVTTRAWRPPPPWAACWNGANTTSTRSWCGLRQMRRHLSHRLTGAPGQRAPGRGA